MPTGICPGIRTRDRGEKPRRSRRGSAPGRSRTGSTMSKRRPRLLGDHVQSAPHIDDCDAANGALKVVPGSHRHGRLTDGEVRDAARQGPAVTARRGRPCPRHESDHHPCERCFDSPRRRRVLHVDMCGRIARNSPGRLRCEIQVGLVETRAMPVGAGRSFAIGEAIDPGQRHALHAERPKSTDRSLRPCGHWRSVLQRHGGRLGDRPREAVATSFTVSLLTRHAIV